MNRLIVTTLLYASLLSCANPSDENVGPNETLGEVVPASVVWVEWPAEVVANELAPVTLVFSGLCAHGTLEIRQIPDSAITFAARWVNVRPINLPDPCGVAGGYHFAKELVAAVPASPPPTLTVRATSHGVASFRTFGSANVVSTVVDRRIRVAGKGVVLERSDGCQWLLAGAWLPTGRGHPVHDRVSDALVGGVHEFVGYLERSVTSVCGDSLVFHATPP